MPLRPSTFSPFLSWSAAALWAALVPIWLLAASGHGPPEVLSRAVLLAALAATFAALALGARDAWRTDRGSLLLAGLVVLALAVRFAGIEHEVAERYYLDEGTYARHATEINRGELLVSTFVYPHLLYYLDAFVIWLASLGGGLAVKATSALYGISDWPVVCRLLMRSVSALLGALTVVPVYRIGRILSAGAGLPGRWAAGLGALLIVFSPPYNDGSHLAICDVPSAFFATLALAFCARLLERESVRNYMFAGAAAGLAASAKYPAGLVALAIVAVWLRWRWRERRFGAGLVWGGAASLLTFLLCNPGLLAFPRTALHGQRGIFFGVFQYAGEGWLGVVPESRTLYYLKGLAESFGWPALVAGALGLALALRRDTERRLAWLAPFPVAYLVLLCNLTVAVKRNLYPALPAVAAFLGVGLAVVLFALAARFPRRSLRSVPAWLPSALLAASLLALPAIATVRQSVAFTRPGTRVLAREWIRAHVPRGATILKDDYTPDFDPGEYAAWRPKGVRFVGQVAEKQREELGWDLILTSAAAYQRFFDPAAEADPEALATRKRYQAIFDSGKPLARFPAGPFRDGPDLALYREVLPASGPPAAGALLRAEDAFVPDGAMRPKGAKKVRYTLDGQWLLFRVSLQPGRYRTVLRSPTPQGGALRLVDLGNRELAKAELDPAGTALLEVPPIPISPIGPIAPMAPIAPTPPQAGKLFLYLHLPRGSVVDTLTLEPAGS